MNRRKFVNQIVLGSVGSVALLQTGFSRQDQETQQSDSKAANANAKQETDNKPKPLDSALVRQFVGSSHGNFKGVKEMVAKEPRLVYASWDWVDGDFETGLGAASHVGNRDIATYLLDNHARIDAFAMAMLGEADLLKPIFKAFPKTHSIPGPHGIPLLCHAIYGRDKADDVFELILESGADLNQASNSGQSALMAAASVGRVEIIKALLEKGADIRQKDAKGKTAVDYARSRKHDDAIKLLESIG